MPWKKQRGVWVLGPEQNPLAKVADRPHWITIGIGAIGILSPTVGIVALIISLQALNTSQQSMKVGQRGYLTLTEGHFLLKPALLPLTNYGHSVLVDVGSTIYNSGNTPIYITGLSLSYMRRPDGWTSNMHMGPDFDSTYIAARSTAHWSEKTFFQLNDEALGRVRNRVGGTQYVNPNDKSCVTNCVLYAYSMAILGRLDYKDVFGDFHTIRWCWFNGSGTPNPVECPFEGTSNQVTQDSLLK